MFKKLFLVILFIFTVSNANGVTEPTCESVTKLYIATFNRAPDASGLCYWLNSGFSIEEIAESFFDQPETQALYLDTLSNVEFVNAIYNNVLGRDADPEGLAYWVNALDSGSISRSKFILAIINGAQGDDAIMLDNKAEVGLAYVCCTEFYDIHEAHAIMENITAYPQSVIDALDEYGLSECPKPDRPSICCQCCEGVITHNGTDYCTVISPYTGQIWLDRNVGAKQACTAYNDPDCYGDYYQWGRNFDGHQNSTSGTTTQQATNVNTVGHGDFIKGSSDWASIDVDTRSANWSTVDGSSICPIGYRVPTKTELSIETTQNGVSNRETAFTNFLKLPSSGHRDYNSGSMGAVGSNGNVWTDTNHLGFTVDNASWNYASRRAYGLSVRCVKD